MPWSTSELARFAERVQLARQVAYKDHPQRGTTGLELEWNIVDGQFQPLRQVGRGANARSFADALRGEWLPRWLAERSQLEVFHWMIELTTQPHYSPQATIFEARLLEAGLARGLARASQECGTPLYAWHGNLLSRVDVDHASIPGGWNLAKRHYLERCVDLFGADLATAGIHANLSLPEPLLMWDFVHLAPAQRGETHFDDYKNRVYIDGTRLLRAFASLFIALSASTPLRAEVRSGQPVVLLTDCDSMRMLTFPDPEAIDLPDLYRSHADYLRLSYDLVRRGVRFGNNNWTPVRARSFAEPVERLISISSEQLRHLYRQGLYDAEASASVAEMAERIVAQNLIARIDLPMARVEVRTDEGGHPLALDIANLTLKEILLLRCYGDPTYARAFRYDAEDLARARRSERTAATQGMRGEIEDPFSGKPLGMRAFLRRTLDEVRPLAASLGLVPWLEPLEGIAGGGPNTAERLRQRIAAELGSDQCVPVDLLRQLAEERRAEVARDVEQIWAELANAEPEPGKLHMVWELAFGEPLDLEPTAMPPPLPLRTEGGGPPDPVAEIVELAQYLVAIPSVSVAGPGGKRPHEVGRAASVVFDYLRNAGLEARWYGDGLSPALLAWFPGGSCAPVMLAGHLDVVAPDPDNSQFRPRVEGDYLWGRGACDMKTVLATFLVWMKETRRKGPPYPPLNLLVVGNEETGEGEPFGTAHVLASLKGESGYEPGLLLAGERTGERGDERVGEICVENRGLVRLQIAARGRRTHTGLRPPGEDVAGRLFRTREFLLGQAQAWLSSGGESAWKSSLQFPFWNVGEAGTFNISASQGALGLEIRPIPQEDIHPLLEEIRDYCQREGLQLTVINEENGIACARNNPYLLALIAAVRSTTGVEPRLGQKLPATSARFAPGGQGVVWGQTGIGPHAAEERHYLPSILPYYQALSAFAHECARLGGAVSPPEEKGL